MQFVLLYVASVCALYIFASASESLELHDLEGKDEDFEVFLDLNEKDEEAEKIRNKDKLLRYIGILGSYLACILYVFSTFISRKKTKKGSKLYKISLILQSNVSAGGAGWGVAVRSVPYRDSLHEGAMPLTVYDAAIP